MSATCGLKVISPGFQTTVQDLGRFGYQAFGVPVSGALDHLSLRIANRLVGNPPNTAALEIFLYGPTLEVQVKSTRVALAGGGVLEVTTAPRRLVSSYQTVYLRRGDVFRAGASLRRSSCAYLAIQGGVALEPVLGSLSTSVRAKIGGFRGRSLRAGDVLPLAVYEVEQRAEWALPAVPKDDSYQPIRVVLGPQDDYFTTQAIETFFTAEYTVTEEFDRMGMRLAGPKLEHNNKGYDIVSDAITTGAIQVPGSGQPIILLADHQTTGGYPKIATIISADIPRVARKRPGDKIKFMPVSVEEAEQIRRDQEAELEKLFESIRTTDPNRITEPEELYSLNLISGVVNAAD